MEKRLACVCCFYCLCTCGFRTVCYVSRSSLRKGDPSWSVTLTWSVPLSLTSLRILISSFFCLYVSVFMYVCFSRCYFHETTKGRKRWVLILNRNLSCFLLFPNTIQPTFTCWSPIKGNADSGIQEILHVKSGILGSGIPGTQLKDSGSHLWLESGIQLPRSWSAPF